MAFKISYVYIYITKLYRQQAEAIQSRDNWVVQVQVTLRLTVNSLFGKDGPQRKQFLYFRMGNCCGEVFKVSLPSNESLLWLHNSNFYVLGGRENHMI